MYGTWENHRKIIGKSREKGDFGIFNGGFIGFYADSIAIQ
jgi:hypothetical protein